MNIKRPLLYAAGGFVLGEVCFLLPAWLSAGIPMVLTAGVCYLWKKREKSGRSLLWWILPLFLLLGMGSMCGDRMRTDKAERILSQVKEKRTEVKGNVAAVGYGDSWVSLKLSQVTLETEGECREYFPVMAYVDREEYQEENRLRIGMQVSVEGELEGFSKPGNPGEFDYGTYYHALGIEGRIYGEKLRITGQEYSAYLDGIFRIKKEAGRILKNLCSQEDLGVFQAVVLGDKSQLPGEIRDLYQKNGIAHLLAVSGLHVSVIGMGLYRGLRKRGISFGMAGGAAACITVSYGILAGGSASVVRAVVMICLQILADRLGRTYDMLSATAAAALLLLLQSPSYLFQSGFQLSFGAVLAIGAVMPALSKWTGVKKRWEQAVLLDVVIQIVTYPVIVYHFFEYPVYGMVLNLLVIPLMGYVLLSGLAGILLGAAGAGLGLAQSLPEAVALWAGEWAIGTGHYILAFYQWLCTNFQKLPAAVQIVGRPKLWQIGVYGGMWLAVLAAAERGEKKAGSMRKAGHREKEETVLPQQKICRSAVILVMMAAGYLILKPLPPTGLWAAFLDVGQGDGICLRTKDVVILADGGSSDEKKLGEQVLEPYLKSQGIAAIDYAIVSHGDQDHISGLTYLLESQCQIRIRHLVLPWLGKEDEACKRLWELAEDMGVLVHWMREGDFIQEGPLTVKCLYAGQEGKKQDRNEHSLLLQVTYGRTGILLTGDMSAEGEKTWLKKKEEEKGEGDDVQVQILKVAHHGSGSSSCEEFLKQAAPDCAVISCGRGNRYGHPAPETIERLEKLEIAYLITMEHGAVLLETDGEKVKIK